MRSQDNFVVQWADPADADHKKPLGAGKKTLPAEFDRGAAGLQFVALPDPDTYAPQTGFVSGFPAARDKADGTAWLVHCYSMVGAGRDNAVDSGPGTEIYVVSGHAPRQLDRNVALFGRVVQGMELLAVMPRGPAADGLLRQSRSSACRSARSASPPTCPPTSAPSWSCCAPTRRRSRI